MGSRSATASDAAPLSPTPRSKTAPPAWSHGRLERHRLLGRLDQAARRARLTTVTGPAGSGKTVGLSQLYDAWTSRGDPLAWLSLDRADGDARVLLSSLVRSLEVVLGLAPSEVVGTALELLGQEPVLAVRALMTWPALSEAQIRLAVDGYDAISGSAGARLIDAWVRAGASPLIVAGRIAPELPVAMMKARGEAEEIGAKDLAFDAAELDRLCGGRLGTYYLEKLLKETDGTPIAACYALQSLVEPTQPHHAAGAAWTEGLQDYYREQILADLAPEAREILCRLAILEMFDISLARAIQGAPAARLIEDLFRVRGLILRDRSTRLYHLPKGLRDSLAMELEWVDEAEVREIHQRAAHWFLSRRLPFHAALHAVAADDQRMAADCIGQVGALAFGARFGMSQLREGLDRLSERQVNRQPALSSARALVLSQEDPTRFNRPAGGAVAPPSNGDSIVAAAFMCSYADVVPGGAILEGCHSLSASTDGDGDISSRGLARNMLAWVNLRQARLDEAMRWGRLALADLERADAAYAAAFVHFHASSIAFLQDDAAQARQAVAEAEAIVKLFYPGHERLTNLVWLHSVALDHDQGAMLPVEDLIAVAAFTRHGEGWIDAIAQAHILASRQLQRRGDFDRADHVLDQALDVADSRAAPRLAWIVRCEQVRLAMAAGRLDSARRQARALNLDEMRDPLDAGVLSWREVTEGWTTAAALALRSGQREEARRIAGALSRFVEQNAAPRLAVSVRLLTAAIEGRAMAGGAAHDAGFLQADLRDLLGPGGRVAAAVQTVSGAAERDMGAEAAALTGRERELMTFVARGLVNKQIAYELGLSETTVKFHMRNVFRKLGARNRIQALVRLGLG